MAIAFAPSSRHHHESERPASYVASPDFAESSISPGERHSPVQPTVAAAATKSRLSIRQHLGLSPIPTPVRRHHYLSKFQPHPNADTRVPEDNIAPDGGGALLMPATAHPQERRRGGRGGMFWLSRHSRRNAEEEVEVQAGRRMRLRHSQSCFPGRIGSRHRRPQDDAGVHHSVSMWGGPGERTSSPGSSATIYDIHEREGHFEWVQISVPSWLGGGKFSVPVPHSDGLLYLAGNNNSRTVSNTRSNAQRTS
eukprot:GHVS01098489.1.p1 GENE.GHVS01098489.1~~GHVS01098489.1.p1  ORF type:complete len:252 (-),score=33.46 GHVS01098489.1:310-1065(-)